MRSAGGAYAADLMGAAEATRPLAEIALAADAQTPFLIGFVGPSGSGASFALRRWVENVEALAAAAGRTAGSPFLSKVVVASIDAAGVSGDPACAIASAAFAALERDRDGVNYAALADEAANAGADPLRAAAAAAERHDELVRRLESERAARDDVEAKRARLTDALLYETPGSRVDAFIRANRGAIESRLRRFDLAEGDATTNFRHLVRDFDGAGPAARAGVAVRAIWAYRGQLGWLLAAVIAFALAFAVDEARAPQAGDGLRALASFLAPVADWLAAHQGWLVGLSKALTAIGALALLVVLWRAFAFAGLLYRGQRLLGHDVRERRRDLEASAARLNQRVAALDAQAEAAARHVEATSQARRRRQTLRTRARPGLRQRPRGAAPRRALVLRRARTADERRRRARARRAAAHRLRVRQSRRAGAQRRRAAPRSRARVARSGLRRRRGLRSGGAHAPRRPRNGAAAAGKAVPDRLQRRDLGARPTAAASRRG